MSEDDSIEFHIRAVMESDSEFPARSAVASFLFMVMPIDGQTHPKEMERLVRILSDDFSLSAEETEALIEHARTSASDPETMAGLADILKNDLTKNELLTLISHMWEMVFADGRLHESEINLVEKVAGLLDISPVEVAKAMHS